MRAALVIGVIIVAALALSFVFFQPTTGGGKQFTSYDEVTAFVKAHSEYTAYGGGLHGDVMMATTGENLAQAPEAAPSKAEEYSTTNIQVAGVDEPDLVKNDGKYIYTISSDKVFIVDAYPAENANVSSVIEFNGYVSDIFINNNKLIVFSNTWENIFVGAVNTAPGMLVNATAETTVSAKPTLPRTTALEGGFMPPHYSSASTMYVYDVSDHADPKLVRNVSVSGNYYDARMIGDYVYMIASQPVQIMDSGPVIQPVIAAGARVENIPASKITYFDTYDTSFVYTTVVALNTQNDLEEPNEKVFLLGYSQNMYVSPENIYVVYTKYITQTERFNRLLEQAVFPNIPSDLKSQIDEIQSLQNMTSYEKQNAIGQLVTRYAESLGPEEGAKFMAKIETAVQDVTKEIEKESEKTIVHKIAVSGASIEYKTSGEAPGRVLNQFSMDEYNGNFRVATTTGNTWDNSSLNHIYVLDSGLNTIGKLENLAQSEQIYSARFMGDRAYLVTFRRTDPLFVIDMSNPTAPAVLGQLKIPGFSEYLHPYDGDHLIGFGQQTDDNGRRTGQLKLALFDVSDVANPKELSTYLIGNASGDYTYSEASNDHKAFMFSKSKNLLVIPVSSNNWNENRYFQGAYVFDVTLENGFNLKGKVSHIVENASEDQQYYDYQSAVHRSLYMDDVLYTISDKRIRANSLVDMGDIKLIELEAVGATPVP